MTITRARAGAMRRDELIDALVRDEAELEILKAEGDFAGALARVQGLAAELEVAAEAEGALSPVAAEIAAMIRRALAEPEEGSPPVAGVNVPRPRTGNQVDNFSPGDHVTYVPAFGPTEDGVVTSVQGDHVFVRYKPNQEYGTATRPGDLEWTPEREHG